MKYRESKYQLSCLVSSKEIDFWGQFVYENKGGFFQSIQYFELCNRIIGHEPIIIAAYSNGEVVGSILAIIQTTGFGIRKFFSRRAIVIGGPILKLDLNDSLLVEDLLIKLNSSLIARAIYIEFRNLFDLSMYYENFVAQGYKYHEHLNVKLPLSTIEIISKGLSNSKKRQIKQTIKNGGEIVQPENINDIKAFFQILQTLYKSKVKKPLPPWEFFEEVYYRSLKTEYFRFHIIKYNNEVIGGILSPVYNGTIYEWYIGTKEINNNNLYPGVLATWAAIEYGINNNLTQFDFLGAGKPGEDYGVREFKLKFGGELVQNGRFLRINQRIAFAIGVFAISYLKIR